MRPPSLSDIDHCALALLGAPPGRRAARARAILKGAALADAHRAATGRLHPRWGSGTLISAAQAYRAAPRPPAGDRAYLEALALVTVLLLARV